MPSYDYKCDKCEEVFGYIVSFEIADIYRECPKPKCNGKLNRETVYPIALGGMDSNGSSKPPRRKR